MMGKFIRFKIIAERADGSYAKFTITPPTSMYPTPRPERGTTHEDAHNAETDLYNRLVRKFQEEDIMPNPMYKHQMPTEVLKDRIVELEARVKELEADSRKLAALEAGGVDNWEGYEIALEEMEQDA